MNIIQESTAGYYHILLLLAVIVGLSVAIAIAARILRWRKTARIAFTFFVISLLTFAAIFFYVILVLWKPVKPF
jgi:uncharacterized protein with PQ loop repeat